MPPSQPADESAQILEECEPQGGSTAVHEYFRPLQEAPDAADLALHRRNCDPALVTARLRSLVPLLDAVQFRATEITPHRTVLEIPLEVDAVNQNGTHQASVFYLLADYTLGVGLIAALPGTYVVGVHDRCSALPVKLWLRSGRVEHHGPGTGTIRGEIEISEEAAVALRKELLVKGRAVLRDTVRIYQEEKLIATAEHEMGVYADLPRSASQRASAVQVDSLKTSALMIAGLRHDELSHALAGEQGRAVAQRMASTTPQLPSLVQARTKHIRQQLEHRHATTRQVLVLGVGLDSKPTDLATADQPWFLADLRDMLRERDSRLTALDLQNPHVVNVALDFRQPDWADRVLAAGFDPTRPSALLLEGYSMYPEADQLRALLAKLRSLCLSTGSWLWLDHVTQRLRGSTLPEATAFFAAMSRLGEPFLTSFDDAEHFAGPDWRPEGASSAGEVTGIRDEVHDGYLFSVLRPSSASQG